MRQNRCSQLHFGAIRLLSQPFFGHLNLLCQACLHRIGLGVQWLNVASGGYLLVDIRENVNDSVSLFVREPTLFTEAAKSLTWVGEGRDTGKQRYMSPLVLVRTESGRFRSSACMGQARQECTRRSRTKTMTMAPSTNYVGVLWKLWRSTSLKGRNIARGLRDEYVRQKEKSGTAGGPAMPL